MIARLVLRAAIACMLAASMLGASGQIGSRSAMVTSAVDVDGLALRVRTAGLQERRAGHPAVIFESGGGAPLETWDPIFLGVADFAAVVAYDRVGTGQSAWDSLPPTPERVVARLRRLLVTLNVAPPYVLVGHSWGGALIRYFGGGSPRDVAGMVYLDPTDITQEPRDEVAIFESIGAGAAARDAFYELMERAMANAPAPLRAQAANSSGCADDRHSRWKAAGFASEWSPIRYEEVRRCDTTGATAAAARMGPPGGRVRGRDQRWPHGPRGRARTRDRRHPPSGAGSLTKCVQLRTRPNTRMQSTRRVSLVGARLIRKR
jgi:pimeloyl-ACP methyl ester carboxylesterase